MDSLVKRPKHRKKDMRFRTWNVRSLYRIGSLTTVARELGEYKLDLVGVQEVRWEKGGTERAEGYRKSPDIIRQIKSRRIRWAGHVARMGEGRNVYRVLVGKPEGKRSLGRPRRRWEDGIKMDLREIGWGGGVWSGFTWLRIRIVGGLL
jgi:hypothetical protein